MKRLSKLPENKTCCDCPEKMPSYVNLTHRSFICTTCSGIHRELQSKIKGVSMSTFVAEDVADMTAGGNASCNALYLARFNNEVPVPTGQDIVRLREFIRMKYVDRRWAAGGGGGAEASQRGQQLQQATATSGGSSRGSGAFSISINSSSTPAPLSQGFSARLSSPPSAGPDLLDMVSSPPPQTQQTLQSSSFDQFNQQPQGSQHVFTGSFDAFGPSSVPQPQPSSSSVFDAFNTPPQQHHVAPAGAATTNIFDGLSAPPPAFHQPQKQPEPAAPAVVKKDFSVFDELVPTPAPAYGGNPFQGHPQQQGMPHNPFQGQPPFGYGAAHHQPGLGFQPPQPGFPPQQPGFHPQQPGFHPQQPGFHPQQPGFHPQQPGFQPQQPGFPPQQPGFHPQQPGFQPQQPGFHPQQPGFDPQQPGFQPQQPGFPQQQPGFQPQQPGFQPQVSYTAPNPFGGQQPPHQGQQSGVVLPQQQQQQEERPADPFSAMGSVAWSGVQAPMTGTGTGINTAGQHHMPPPPPVPSSPTAATETREAVNPFDMF